MKPFSTILEIYISVPVPQRNVTNSSSTFPKQLMVKIVPIVGSAMTYKLVYDRFLEMCRCKEHFVRKECAIAFPVMCEVLGNELFEKSMVGVLD